ncbi:hypothetical protein NDU88_005242 [Pleurodeles waltl]|uniref:Uncharacterized protein n=1 Tax=Pleurodeles waltl TaxID=8319 RepID=A0AAV7UIM8_PLEWA|nr:hypothetical protein NDU88_005242 [Pleurodeles waltl]
MIGQPRSLLGQRQATPCRVYRTRQIRVPMVTWERSRRHYCVSLFPGKRSRPSGRGRSKGLRTRRGASGSERREEDGSRRRSGAAGDDGARDRRRQRQGERGHTRRSAGGEDPRTQPQPRRVVAYKGTVPPRDKRKKS